MLILHKKSLMSTSTIKSHCNYLRPVFRPFLRYNGLFGLVLILLFGIPRFILVLGANVTRSYNLVSIVFVVMWFMPFLFLCKEGRRFIGIKKPDNYAWLIYSLLLGCITCVVLYLCFTFLYGHTISNAFVYISGTNATGGILSPDMRLMYFLIGSLVSMTFSPIGEELFYRGVVHGSFVPHFGEHKASVFDSLAFALTHLAHFGIVYVAGAWQFLLVPALLWVAGMFFTSRIFFLCKQRTGSILGAILAHAAFNITMMYFTFYHIL